MRRNAPIFSNDPKEIAEVIRPRPGEEVNEYCKRVAMRVAYEQAKDAFNHPNPRIRMEARKELLRIGVPPRTEVDLMARRSPLDRIQDRGELMRELAKQLREEATPEEKKQFVRLLKAK